jgi:hypothetical protein
VFSNAFREISSGQKAQTKTMTNLLLSYIALFVAAALIGFAGGWLLRATTSRGPRKDVEDEIERLGHAVRQARQRSEPAS